MRCPHCCRGEQQNLDINNKYIDAILEQTAMINHLVFTGGEPTLCVDKIECFIEQLYEREIPIMSLDITTNGLYIDNKFIEVIKKYSNLIKLAQKYGRNNDNFKLFVNIGVSFDLFHSNLKTVEENLILLQKELKDYAQITRAYSGNYVRNMGRAKSLNHPTLAFDIDDYSNKRIEILDKNHKPLCPQYMTYRIYRPDDILVCCDLLLTAKGNLLSVDLGFTEYDIADNPKYIICNVIDSDIYQSILAYNVGKLDCLTCQAKSLEKVQKNPGETLKQIMIIDAIDKQLSKIKNSRDYQYQFPHINGRRSPIVNSIEEAEMIKKLANERDYLKE